MAQPTLNSRPAIWSGSSGPILYKLTSTNYANAGYRFVVEIWDATAAAKIADAKYYANSSGALTVDVSAFLKSSMSLDNDADLTTADVIYEDGNWVKYYIKYREVWTASSESQVNDSGNPRWAIYGGLHLGVINDFTDYVDATFNFLTLVNEGTAIKDYPFIINFKGLTNAYIRMLRKLSGATLDTTESIISSNNINIFKTIETGTADEIILSVVVGASVLPSLSAFTNQGAGTSWTTGSNPSCSVNVAGTKYLVGAYANPSGYTVSIDYDIDATAASGTGIFRFYLLNSSFSPVGTADSILLGSINNYTGTLSVLATGDVAYVALTVEDSFGITSVDINSITISSSEEVISETKTINILEDCQNIVTLSWRNSLGGWECYPFTYNQEYTWHYSDRKAKRLTLFADNLTLAQWEAIQGLNTLGDLYQTPINEMTTSLNRTSATIGQSVYVLNSDGTKTGVNVIGQANTTATKQKTHSAVVTIEYPELFLQ